MRLVLPPDSLLSQHKIAVSDRIWHKCDEAETDL
jgi:hypothetical protein